MTLPSRESGTLSRSELDDLLIIWQRERCLPSASPAERVQLLLDALADPYDATPWPVRYAILAVAAVLQAQIRSAGRSRHLDGQEDGVSC